MAIPRVVIVGRPNVGKSSLFNWLVGRRIAIVDPTPGVTRDRLDHFIEIEDRHVQLIDTGGMGVKDCDNLTAHIEEQINIAVEAADLILFLVDVRSGDVSFDSYVANRLRHVPVPVLLVANKCDSPEFDFMAEEFHRYGRGVIPVSAKQKRNRTQLLEAIYEALPPEEVEESDEKEVEDPVMKIALVGRRNVGKSTFINTLADAPRVIVSEVPGTTRDSIDVRITVDGQKLLVIDTPGFRRKKSVNTDIDFYSTHRAERSIRRADIALMFLDCGQRIGKVDKKLCDYINVNYKPCIFVVNKWDLMIDHMPTERWAEYINDTFPQMWHAPIAFTTGQSGRNVKKLLNHAQMLYKQSRSRISTGQLNKLISLALERTPPPLYMHRRPRIYYATQFGIQPPTIVLFCNNPDMFPKPYRRYLLGVLRDELDFGEIPIKMYFRKREKHDEKDEIDKKRKN